MKLKTNYDTVLFQKKRSEGSGVYYEVMSYNDNVSYLGNDPPKLIGNIYRSWKHMGCKDVYVFYSRSQTPLYEKDVKAIGAFIHQINNIKHQQQEKEEEKEA